MFKQTTQTHTNSRLGEAHSPKRDDMSPKTKSPRLSEMVEQGRVSSPYIFRLGESGSPERDM